MRVLAPFLSLILLGGCAGYAIDYTKSRDDLVLPELRRYGFTNAQAQCVNRSLSQRLAKGQLGILARTTRLVKRGYSDPSRLQPQDLLYVASFIDDAETSAALSSAASSCNILSDPQIAAAQSEAEPAAATGAADPTGTTPSPLDPAPVAPAAPAPRSVWLNLGAAPTGQAIAIDAASVQDATGYRQAWFRITNPGDPGPTGASYLLRVDCSGRTINPMALRRTGAEGQVTDSKEYGPNGEGALAVEGGTVMEIAYLALCT